MIDTKIFRMAKGLMGKHGGFGSGGHHPWVSRDYAEVDCRATGCTFNVEGKCGVPSLCRINVTGGCDGFKARALPAEKTGD